MMDSTPYVKSIVNVEVVLSSSCSLSNADVQSRVKDFLDNVTECVQSFDKVHFVNSNLHEVVESISICDYDIGQFEMGVSFVDLEAKFFIYYLNPHQMFFDEFTSGEHENVLSNANQWVLPSADFHGLWENLIFEPTIKSRLLNYVSTMMLYSDKNVNSNIILGNRVVLLHGPPGSGKTSLCRALAQKLCIRFSNRYKYGHFIEVNSHSLFSKWFSESGKLVMRMFNSIKELIHDDSGLVVLLIDEVESLTRARNSSMSGTEPGDAIRVVNALLTQLDSISKFPNVLILTTSNLCDAIDLAFVDRVDIKQFIGLPSSIAIYQIYSSCVTELMRVGIISPTKPLLNFKSFENLSSANSEDCNPSQYLFKVAGHSVGLSGRTLRKVPLMAHSLFIKEEVVTLETYLEALMRTVHKQFEDLKKMS